MVEVIKVFVFLILFQGRIEAYLSFKGKIMRLFGKLGIYEPEVTRTLKKYINSGDTVIDIGAHLGVITQQLLNQVGNAGKVIAIEPQRLLCSEIKKIFSDSVITHCLALSDKPSDKKLILYVPYLYNILPEPALASLIKPSGKYQEFSVDISTLDNIVSADCNITFIKIDVEGHEIPVLNGGSETIRRCNPTILTEINNYDEASRVAWKNWCERFGYSLPVQLEGGYNYVIVALAKCVAVL